MYMYIRHKNIMQDSVSTLCRSWIPLIVEILDRNRLYGSSGDSFGSIGKGQYRASPASRDQQPHTHHRGDCAQSTVHLSNT